MMIMIGEEEHGRERAGLEGELTMWLLGLAATVEAVEIGQAVEIRDGVLIFTKTLSAMARYGGEDSGK